MIEFGAVSLNQLMQQKQAHGIYENRNVIYRNGNSINIEVPKGVIFIFHDLGSLRINPYLVTLFP